MSEICKGDLVVCLGGINPECHKYIGSIRTVLSKSNLFADSYLLDPPTLGSLGGRIHWFRKRLKRLDPDALTESTPTKESIPA